MARFNWDKNRVVLIVQLHYKTEIPMLVDVSGSECISLVAHTPINTHTHKRGKLLTPLDLMPFGTAHFHETNTHAALTVDVKSRAEISEIGI